METEGRETLLASYAMWAKDYEGALEFYTKLLQSEKRLGTMSLYRIHFDLAIASTVLRKREVANVYINKLEQVFNSVERIRDNIKGRTNLSIEEIQSQIAKQIDPKKIDNLLTEYFPSDEGLLAFFISPRYARGFLRTAIRNAETSRAPQVLKEGIFRYTLSSELYRVIGMAYSTQELTLENLHQLRPVRVLIENPNVYYVEDEHLRTIAGVQREGLVLCQYLLQNSQDATGASQIRAFLHNLSKTFSGQ